MKRFAVALALCSLLFPSLASAGEVQLIRVTWLIDQDCPGVGNDDDIIVFLDPVGLGDNPTYSVWVGPQTTPLSCPYWQNGWTIAGDAPISLRHKLTTQLYKAVRIRASWEGGSRDWIIEPPDGGDTCWSAPEAPNCQVVPEP